MKKEKTAQEKVDTFVEGVAIVLIMISAFFIMLIVCI